MRLETRAVQGGSQRDALERLQEDLRAVRQRREALPRENAELAAEVARLEQEIWGLRQQMDAVHAEAERPASSLPGQLVPPFFVLPSRRTLYGRLRFALLAMPKLPLYLGYLCLSGWVGRVTVLGGFVLLHLLLSALFLQGPEDDDAPTWSFGAEGFSSINCDARTPRVRVRYSELRRVEVQRGWLQRLFGFGSIRVTWSSEEMTSSEGMAAPSQTVDIDVLDEPERLAEWLRARAPTGKGVDRAG
ncbi:hypothetical protein [Archangium minus]|uniref:hypothetical protein n=1 Tax=Archangium minus TaxID=83450 RepID=UPI0037BE4182